MMRIWMIVIALIIGYLLTLFQFIAIKEAFNDIKKCERESIQNYREILEIIEGV